jgi:hypothetical protein
MSFPKFAPLLLGLGLFVVNNLAVFSGWVAPPDGYVALLRVDSPDNAIYDAWLRSSVERLLHPNFQAPWLTEPAVAMPLMFLVARMSGLMGIALDLGWLLAHLALHVLTAYALVAALEAFLKSHHERWMAFVAIVLVVPVQSLLVLPSAVLPLDQFGVSSLPGLAKFVWTTSDGFFHGISSSHLVTYGTAMTLAAFAFLARYMETGRARHLAASGIAVFLCGLVHPYEPYLIIGAGSLALVIWQWPLVGRAVPGVAVLGGCGALGVAPMAAAALTTPWVRDTAGITRWNAPNLGELLVTLGLPAMAAVVLVAVRPRIMRSATDVLLQCWVVGTLVAIYLPFVPWSQHLLDGFHYGVGMLLVRQVTQTPWIVGVWTRHRRPVAVLVGALLVLSVVPYVAYSIQSWHDGRRPEPDRLFRSVAPAEDVAARNWLAENARHTDLVLAPLGRATWFASVPMHSFASNRLFSITFREQSRLSGEFFSGGMDADAANRLLSGYGVRWVVVPRASPAVAYIAHARERARFGHWAIYELEGNTMKPYPGLPR